jgi:hypothetical protein
MKSPAAATVNPQGDAAPEIVVSLNDGFMRAFTAQAAELWRNNYTHGMDVFTVPGSAANCLPWPTARGGPLRMGQPNDSGLSAGLFAGDVEVSEL